MRSSPCIILALASIAVAANQIIHHNGACHLYRRQNNNNYMPQDDSGNADGGGNADAMYPYGSGNSDPYANDNLQYPDQYGSGSPFSSNYNSIPPQQQYNGNSLQQPSNSNYYVPAQNTAAGYPQNLSGNNAPYPSQQQQQLVANPAPTSPAQETGLATQTQSIPSTIFDDLPGFLGITFPNQFQTTSYSTSMSDASDSHSESDTQNGSGSDAENSAASASSDQSNSADNLSTSNAPAAQLNAALAIILALITYLV
ncbi:hypothetical protein H4217_001614 [Coemansia sp. RSA 1939]|nr:hypothetical protein H4217_001614 [Coemansia sp. RSA 1939]KAJ2610476.1 hypothetical protein EV177_003958 [Coemansia sp. RSA 1804]KAJ2694816.1 hypothetical protein GGH99_000477 [Coemansia sp. RSA 1285]